MARDLRSLAYFLQYLNIEIQIQGFEIWRKEFTRFRDRRDFDVCAQLISLAGTTKLDQESLDQVRFYEAELALLHDKNEYAERLFRYLTAHASADSLRAEVLYRLADIERGTGRFESALKNYQNALQIFRQINDRTAIPYILHMVGVIYWAQENLDEAIRFYEMSLQHYRDLYDGWSEQQLKPSNIVLNREDIQRHMANILRDIADAHRRAGRLEIAQDRLLESLKIQESIGATFETALTYLSLGKLNREKHLFPESITYYKKALAIAQKTESAMVETESLFRLAEGCYLSGDYESAIDWAEKAVASASTFNFLNLKARALLYQGLSQFMLGSVPQGVDSLLSALEYASQFSPNVLGGVIVETEKILPVIIRSHVDLAERLQVAIKQYKDKLSKS